MSLILYMTVLIALLLKLPTNLFKIQLLTKSKLNSGINSL